MESVVDRKVWMGRRVFLTGHTGFMGGWLALWLKEMGASVHGYALAPPTSPSLFDLGGVKSALKADTRADVREQAVLTAALREAAPDIVFHLAAQPLVLESYRAPVDTFAINVMGTVNLLEAARLQSSVRAIIVVTSDKCYANDDGGCAFVESDPLGGHDPYSASKACAEIVAAAYRDSFYAGTATLATVRAGNIIGGGDWAANRLVPDCLRAFTSGAPVTLRNPNATRPWQHVLEAVSGYLMLAEKLLAGDRACAGGWNFGPDTAASATVAHVADYLASKFGGTVLREVATGAPREAAALALNSTKAASQLGWHPRWALDRALEETANWYAGWQAGENMNALTRAQISRYCA